MRAARRRPISSGCASQSRIAIPAGVLGAILAWLLLPLVRQLHPTPVLGFLLSGAQVDSGVYALPRTGLARLKGQSKLEKLPMASSPVLVFVHGTFVETTSAFGNGAWFVQSALTVVVLFAAASAVSWKLSRIPDGFRQPSHDRARDAAGRAGATPPFACNCESTDGKRWPIA